jgi:arylsulfatase
MKNFGRIVFAFGLTVFFILVARLQSSCAEEIDRTALPIPDAQYKYPGKVPLDARDAKFPPIKPLRPPQGAPNVVVILLDDIGFGAPSTFGGGINMPTLDSLAKSGLRYTQFHTTALCSPTREALLTGHNHHSVGMGAITELATSAPGYNSIRPNQAATVAEILKLNRYNTAAFGKIHKTPPWEISVSRPFTRLGLKVRLSNRRPDLVASVLNSAVTVE